MANILTFYKNFDYDNETNESNTITTVVIKDFDLKVYLNFRITLTWISLFIIVIGLFGNMVSFLILINKKMRISTNVFLASLCVSAFMALTGLLINSVIYELLAYYKKLKALEILYFFYPYFYPLVTTFQMVSILLTVCVSVNQFFCVFFLRTKIFSKKANEKDCKSALTIVVFMFLISILYCVPYWLKFEYKPEIGLTYTELGKDPLFNKIVHFWMYLFVCYIIPFSILMITNTYLLVTIMIAKRRRKRLGMDKTENGDIELLDKKLSTILQRLPTQKLSKSRSSRSRTNITLMLIAVVFFFFICQFPTLVLHIALVWICSNELSICSGSVYFQYCHAVSKFLLICNLSFNFVIYCLFSEKFRQVLKETLKISKNDKNKDDATSRRASIL